MITWHRHFGLILTDLFTGTCYEVELEKDLSQKRQLLDIVVVRRTEGQLDRELPDGFENLAGHNLLTFKSHHEALDDWALKELTAHYVNYRKQVSPAFDRLLPEAEFRLFAVCARRPEKLAAELTLTELQPGVYDAVRGTDIIRVVVASEVPQVPRNSPLHLFSGIPAAVGYGAAHLSIYSSDTSTLINRLFEHYEIEGIDMPYTMEDFRREVLQEQLEKLSVEEILASLPEEVLRKIREQLAQEDAEPTNGNGAG